MKRSYNSMKMLTRIYSLYDFIIAYKKEHDGNSPCVREMCNEIGIRSTSLLVYYLEALEDRGLIRVDSGKERSICVTGGQWRMQP